MSKLKNRNLNKIYLEKFNFWTYNILKKCYKILSLVLYVYI